MPITNPIAIKYVNEVVRPLAERFRDLKPDVDAATVAWFAGISTLFPNDATAVDDGRDREGISRLTGADVNNIVTQLLAYQTQLNGGGVANVIAKPCVRTLVTR